MVPANAPLGAALARLVRDARAVFLAGLPGTGKSLLLHQLAQLAHAAGRPVHLLQWDVARPAFEAHPAGRAYPQVDGVTHGLIRLAAGRWARGAVARWHARHAARGGFLLGETPLVGHRFVELARPARDRAEAVLAAPGTRFVIPVPSAALRAHLEAERERRARAPEHPREREDAPPGVLRALWAELVAVAGALGLEAPAGGPGGAPPYDPGLYQRVYERVLVRRHAEALPLDQRLDTAGMSPYALGVPAVDLVPTDAEVRAAIRDAARRWADPEALRRAIAEWYRAG